MPPLEELEKSGETHLRILAYGPTKHRKTWWAGTAAEAGFNVVVLAGEEGTGIYKHTLSEKAKRRIQVLDLRSAYQDPVFPDFIGSLCRKSPFCWDENAKSVRTMATSCKPDNSHYYVDPSQLNTNDVLVLDSWTRLADGILIRAGLDKGADFANVDKIPRDIYGYMTHFVTWVMTHMMSLDCHIIFIGHETQYEKYSVPQREGEKAQLLWSKTQIASTSNPNGMKMGQYFGEILRFYKVGDNVRISTKGDEDTLGGCRHIPPGVFKWDELQFRDVCRLVGIKMPSEGEAASRAFRWYPPGIEVDELVARANKLSGKKGPVVPNKAAEGPLFKEPLTATVQPSNITVPTTQAKVSLADKLRLSRQQSKQTGDK